MNFLAYYEFYLALNTAFFSHEYPADFQESLLLTPASLISLPAQRICEGTLPCSALPHPIPPSCFRAVH
jgi:hypothetical protein